MRSTISCCYHRHVPFSYTRKRSVALCDFTPEMNWLTTDVIQKFSSSIHTLTKQFCYFFRLFLIFFVVFVLSRVSNFATSIDLKYHEIWFITNVCENFRHWSITSWKQKSNRGAINSCINSVYGSKSVYLLLNNFLENIINYVVSLFLWASIVEEEKKTLKHYCIHWANTFSL